MVIRAVTRGCIMALIFSNGLPCCAQGVDIHDVIQTWKNGQKNVKSAKMTFMGTTKAWPDRWEVPQLLGGKVGVNGDGKEQQFLEQDFRLIISVIGYEGCSRIETDRPTVNLRANKLVPCEIVSVFDGVEHSRILNRGDAGRAGGQIFPAESGNDLWRRVLFKPVMLAFRPFCPQMRGLNPATLVPLVPYDGELPLVRSGSTDMWLDPDNSYVVKKFAIRNRDESNRMEVDIDYELRQGVLVPTRWDYREFEADAQVKLQVLVRLTDVELNQAIPPSEFQITFPPGAIVVKNRYDKRGVRSVDFAIVKTNGDLLPVPRARLDDVIERGEEALTGESAP